MDSFGIDIPSQTTWEIFQKDETANRPWHSCLNACGQRDSLLLNIAITRS